jgi:chromosome segregation ATPase
MPYSIDYKNKCVYKKIKKVKDGKKITVRGEKVGCTKGSLDDYIAALQIHAENKMKTKKTIKEAADMSLSNVYAVQNPYSGCQVTDLVKPVDPLVGLQQIQPDQIHSVYADQPMAQSVADNLFQEYSKKQAALEEKKEETSKKVKTVLDTLEKKRKEYMDMAKEDPKNASKHREQIALITSKIDDLMTKLEKIEKSKKEIEKESDKDKKDKK